MGELNEKLKKIQEYADQLKEELNGKKGKNGEPDVPSLEEQKKEIVKKLSSGEINALKGTKELKRIEAKIQEITTFLKKYDALRELFTSKAALLVLSEGKDKDGNKLTKDQKQKIIASLSKTLLDSLKPDNVAIAMLLGVEEKDLDLNKAKKDLEDKIKELDSDIEVLKKRNLDTTELNDEKVAKEAILKKVQKALDSAIDEATLKSDLQKLANSKTKKADKQAILNKYSELTDSKINALIDELMAVIDKKEFKEETKAKLANITEQTKSWLKEHGKAIGWTTGIASLIILIVVWANSCEKTNSKPEDTKTPTNTTTPEENDTRNNIDALMNKGYNEYFATLMVKNFSEEEIAKLLNSPYIVMVENYAVVENGFNLDYINDYENARTIYNITTDKAVDYVNRAYKIEPTGFYVDATINDIVAVLKSIDEKVLFTADNVELRQSINAPLTEVYNNYAFGTLTEADKNKINALQYFAPDGSDLDNFLSEYALIVQQVLSANGNQEITAKAQQEMYTYLNTFANTYTGYVSEGEFTNPNENAIVSDTFDWNIAYIGFIQPTMSMFITPENAEDFACLQINMLSNYEQWAQLNGCDHTLFLGNEG